LDRIAVLGAGAWGTALAHHLGSHGRPVSLWARRAELAKALRETRHNPLLPGVLLAPAVVVSDSFDEVLERAGTVVLAAPCHTVREVLGNAAEAWPAHATLVTAAKGIENDTLLTVTEVAREVLAERLGAPMVVLSGPSFAREVAAGQPTNVVAASEDESHAEQVQRVFSMGRFRVYTSSDPIGVQVAGALKNVIAIAVGASDGLGLGHNARAALITRGVSEIARLAVARGASRLRRGPRGSGPPRADVYGGALPQPHRGFRARSRQIPGAGAELARARGGRRDDRSQRR
jgi:glycerol-3-phosphate dehydrogenase (NAD(P)+)